MPKYTKSRKKRSMRIRKQTRNTRRYVGGGIQENIRKNIESLKQSKSESNFRKFSRKYHPSSIVAQRKYGLTPDQLNPYFQSFSAQWDAIQEGVAPEPAPVPRPAPRPAPAPQPAPEPAPAPQPAPAPAPVPSPPPVPAGGVGQGYPPGPMPPQGYQGKLRRIIGYIDLHTGRHHYTLTPQDLELLYKYNDIYLSKHYGIMRIFEPEPVETVNPTAYYPFAQYPTYPTSTPLYEEPSQPRRRGARAGSPPPQRFTENSANGINSNNANTFCTPKGCFRRTRKVGKGIFNTVKGLFSPQKSEENES